MLSRHLHFLFISTHKNYFFKYQHEKSVKHNFSKTKVVMKKVEVCSCLYFYSSIIFRLFSSFCRISFNISSRGLENPLDEIVESL